MSNNKFKILIVEDEPTICSFIYTLLDTNGYKTYVAPTCELGKSIFTSYLPDLIILDLGLPDRDGRELIHYVRQKFMTPIIVLSARTTEADKIALRLNRFSSNPTGVFQAQDLLIQYERRKVYVGGEEIKLTQTEYNIVAFLSEHAGRVMTYPAIVRAIWGDTDCGSTKKLQVNMANIRRKLGSRPGHNNYIMNELGVGYRMIDADHDGPDAPADHEENA